MQKTHMKLGLLIAMTCLFVAAGTAVGSTTASAHTLQASKKFHPWFAQKPHITVKLLANTGRQTQHSDVERAVIYGVGFNDCNCDNGSSTTTTTTSTTTTSSTTTSSPTTGTCSSDCSGSTPTGPSNVSGSSYNSCPSNCGSNSSYNSAPSTVSQPSYNSCPSDCGGSNSSYNSNPSYNSAPSTVSQPSYNSCPSDCGSNSSYNSSPNYNSAPNTASAPSYNTSPSDNDCGCNTADLQSSGPISASTSGVNLSQVPVNTFGEFQIVVNVHRAHMHRHYSMPSIWAVNSYNDQPSNYALAPMCVCN